MEDGQKFLKGFNAGYLIAKHNPELLQKIRTGMQESENPLVQGFLSGSREFSKEQIRDDMNRFYKSKQRDEKDKGHER